MTGSGALAAEGGGGTGGGQRVHPQDVGHHHFAEYTRAKPIRTNTAPTTSGGATQ
jgi:hypothetical protein